MIFNFSFNPPFIWVLYWGGNRQQGTEPVLIHKQNVIIRLSARVVTVLESVTSTQHLKTSRSIFDAISLFDSLGANVSLQVSCSLQTFTLWLDVFLLRPAVDVGGPWAGSERSPWSHRAGPGSRICHGQRPSSAAGGPLSDGGGWFQAKRTRASRYQHRPPPTHWSL